jgi:hypothetical protein
MREVSVAKSNVVIVGLLQTRTGKALPIGAGDSDRFGFDSHAFMWISAICHRPID